MGIAGKKTGKKILWKRSIRMRVILMEDCVLVKMEILKQGGREDPDIFIQMKSSLSELESSRKNVRRLQ